MKTTVLETKYALHVLTAYYEQYYNQFKLHCDFSIG